MSKNFEKVVNSPIAALKRAARKLRDKKIPENTPDKIINVGETQIKIPVKKIKKGGKVAGISLIVLMQFIAWAVKYAVLDNHLTRKLEELLAKTKKTDKKGKVKLWRNFVSKNPNLVGHIAYYMMIAATGAGVDLAQDDSAIRQTVKEWVADVTDDEDKNEEDDGKIIYFDEGKSNIKNLNNTVPHLRAISTNQSRSKFVKQALEEYWDEIAVALTELETYRASPRLHSGENRYTNGLGCTWQYWYNDNGVLYREKNLKNNSKTMSADKNYEQVRRHLIYETLPALYNAIKPYDNITPQMQIALLMAGYQRPADMKHIANKLAVATTVQQVADAFADVSSVPSDYRDGTRVRRYTCALYAIGAISAEQILDWTRDSFSMVNVNTIYKNEHFVITQQNIEYLLGRSRPNTNTVREFLNNFDTGRKIVAGIKTSRGKFKFDEKEQDSNYEKSMAVVNKADKKFKKGKYKDAEELYIEALALNPDNMEAYSSLALTYKMLGDKHKSKDYYQKCIDIVNKCNSYMNSNKSMLLDRRVKAMTYYNAGLARMGMGRLAQDAGKISEAKKEYNLAKGNFETALENAKIIDLDSDIINIYEEAIKDAQLKIGALQKLAFNKSTDKVKNQSDILDASRINMEDGRA